MSNEGGGRISNKGGWRTYKGNELKRVEAKTNAMSAKKTKRKYRERKRKWCGLQIMVNNGGIDDDS